MAQEFFDALPIHKFQVNHTLYLKTIPEGFILSQRLKETGLSVLFTAVVWFVHSLGFGESEHVQIQLNSVSI